jgi:cystathionine beta-lyase
MEQLEAALTPDVKVVWIETPSNPLLMITDIEACAEIAHRHGSLLLVDNTFMTPYYQRPLDLGADLVIHSATKYLGGHSDLIAGLVACKTAEYAEKVLAIQNSTGGISQPMDCYLLIRSIKTLALRMERHTENAMTVANALSTHPKIRAVYYPGLPGSDGYEIHKKQASGAGGMLSFELADGGKPRLLFDALKMISLAESLGGVESLICHPATMTHAALTPEMQKSVGITEELIRLSVGIEHIDDILGDLLPAIDAAFV